MPSPLNGLMVPAASPTSTQPGPTFGVTDPPIGRRPPVGGPVEAAGEISQYAGAVAANSSMRCDVLTLFQSRKVESRPMPTLIVPSPTGKIHPYPGNELPLRSRTSSADSIHGSACNGLS